MERRAVVEAINLTKVYDKFTAVDRLNLSVKEGEIYGFLGPNGAGKTTTILMLLGLTEPASGEARVFGYNSTREPLKVKRLAGYLPEKVGFYEDLTARQNLDYIAKLNGLFGRMAEKAIDEALTLVGLMRVADERVGKFSRGMKQRLGIADVLVKDAKIVFLDEPTAGIDPEGVTQTLDLITGMSREHGRTVILSSHQLHQVQKICDRVGIFFKGHLVAEGSIDELGGKALGGGRFQIQARISELSQKLIDKVKGIPGVIKVDNSGNLLLITCDKDLRPEITRAVLDSGSLLVQIQIEEYGLEEIYMKYFREG